MVQGIDTQAQDSKSMFTFGQTEAGSYANSCSRSVSC